MFKRRVDRLETRGRSDARERRAPSRRVGRLRNARLCSVWRDDAQNFGRLNDEEKRVVAFFDRAQFSQRDVDGSPRLNDVESAVEERDENLGSFDESRAERRVLIRTRKTPVGASRRDRKLNDVVALSEKGVKFVALRVSRRGIGARSLVHKRRLGRQRDLR